MSGSRRQLLAGLVASLATFGLIEALWSRELVAAKVRPNLARFFRDLQARVVELRGRRMSDLEFQAVMDDLLGRVDIGALADYVALDRLEQLGEIADAGATVRDYGLPAQMGHVRRLFACRKGRAIVPHGHVGMVSGFVVLRGRWRGRHYEKLESHPEHLIIRPTIDRGFGPGELSTISDHRDNVHWFEAESDAAFIFNIHVGGYDRRLPPGREYLDPERPIDGDGTIRAPRLTREACVAKFADRSGRKVSP